MNRGYIRLYRKTKDNPILRERGKRYSRYEAWLDLCMMARGTDDEPSGLRRGQFEASNRFLARAWNWGLSAVFRFMAELQQNQMIKKVERCLERSAERSAERFSICKYDIYNPNGNAERNTKRNAERNETNTVLKTGPNQEDYLKSDNPPSRFSFPVVGNGNGAFQVTQTDVDHWRALYPNVDVECELRKMTGWIESHSKKTSRGMPRFITSWLAKAQDSSRSGPQLPLSRLATDEDKRNYSPNARD